MRALFVIARDDSMDARLAAEAEGLGWSVLRLPLLVTEPGADGGLRHEEGKAKDAPAKPFG
ncbi:MAG TPA: hypothetical protein VJQ53_05260, partial [Candidatus Eisenbacteria bacterium]|nr:hypothetical protein [Candidatus Eisenbacteria bacterium]